MLFTCESGCEVDIGMTRSRELHRCEKHGLVLTYGKALKRDTPLHQVSKKREGEGWRGSGLRRSQPKRDWADARAKVEEEGCCRICKRTDRKLEAAHVLGREHDEPKSPGSATLYVHPDRIFPACGPFPDGCHGDVDHRRISSLPYLTLDEQLQAVRDAGGIAQARMRLEPVEHREEVEGAAA
jgi:hypothetical protein